MGKQMNSDESAERWALYLFFFLTKNNQKPTYLEKNIKYSEEKHCKGRGFLLPV